MALHGWLGDLINIPISTSDDNRGLTETGDGSNDLVNVVIVSIKNEWTTELNHSHIL